MIRWNGREREAFLTKPYKRRLKRRKGEKVVTWEDHVVFGYIPKKYAEHLLLIIPIKPEEAEEL